MRAARPFLLTSSEELCFTLSALCEGLVQNPSHLRPFSAFLHTRWKRIPFSFNHFRTRCTKQPGVTKSVFLNSSALHSSTFSALTPLDSALTDEHRVLPCFGRNHPPASPLESTLTGNRAVTPLDSALTKKGGGWVDTMSANLHKHRRSIDGGGASGKSAHGLCGVSWFHPQKWCKLPAKPISSNRFALRAQS